jgi:hypothetical protein
MPSPQRSHARWFNRFTAASLSAGSSDAMRIALSLFSLFLVIRLFQRWKNLLLMRITPLAALAQIPKALRSSTVIR